MVGSGRVGSEVRRIHRDQPEALVSIASRNCIVTVKAVANIIAGIAIQIQIQIHIHIHIHSHQISSSLSLS